MSRRSRAAVARSRAGERWGILLVGLFALVAGLLALIVGFGLLGEDRAGRSLLYPLALDTLSEHPNFARLVAAALGVLLLILGLVWAVRSLRPERRPQVVGSEEDPALALPAPPPEPAPADTAADTAAVAAEKDAAEPDAAAAEPELPDERGVAVDAVTADAGALDGVRRARARLVGSDTSPALRLTLWLARDADIRGVCDRLECDVLAPARTALAVPALPAAVRIELDR